MPWKRHFLKVSLEIQNFLIGFLLLQSITFRETNFHSFKKKLEYFINFSFHGYLLKTIIKSNRLRYLKFIDDNLISQ
jgi:hypothetical protein